MRGQRLADRLSGRLPAAGDDRGSLAMAMMAVLVGAMLGGLMLPMVIAQNKATRFDMARVSNLHAAQTGVDVLLGQIRATVTTINDVVVGDPGNLPCSTAGRVNGAGSGTYTVSVVYWVSDPADGGDPMICSPDHGTFDRATSRATPRYAVITSIGSVGTVDSGSQKRTIVSTYTFQTDDSNIPGGLIRLYPSGTAQWCMDGGAAVPVAGEPVVLHACSGSIPPLAQQVFAYRSDLSIQLVSSVTTALPNGLCVDTSGADIVLATCGVVDPAGCPVIITRCSPPNQQWSVDDNAHLRDALGNRSDTGSHCIDAASQADLVHLRLITCAGSIDSIYQTWVPSPTAGAGMAGVTNNQLVNYRQFATCLDVTGQNPDADYLILYTCKQNPDPGKVLWNQKFTPTPALAATAPPTDVLLKTTKDSVTYCLLSPRTEGGYVRTTTPCPASPSAGSPYTWKVHQVQAASGDDLLYRQKYTVEDSSVDSGSSGRCLGPGPNTDLLNGTYLKATVSACDGSTGQKWNATASLDAARITKTHETQ